MVRPRRAPALAADVRRAVRWRSDGLPLDGVAWSAEPTRLPADRNDISYDARIKSLSVADGVLTGVPPEVYAFEVSGMAVIPKWLGYRMAKPAGRAASSSSPLDKIRPTTWDPSLERRTRRDRCRTSCRPSRGSLTALRCSIASSLVPSCPRTSCLKCPLRCASLRRRTSARQTIADLLDGLLPGTDDELF